MECPCLIKAVTQLFPSKPPSLGIQAASCSYKKLRDLERKLLCSVTPLKNQLLRYSSLTQRLKGCRKYLMKLQQFYPVCNGYRSDSSHFYNVAIKVLVLIYGLLFMFVLQFNNQELTSSKVLFFPFNAQGPLYWRFTNGVMDQGYPKPLATGFAGLSGRIVATLPVARYNSRPESVYFIKRGKSCIPEVQETSKAA